MTDDQKPDSLEDLDKRLKRLREKDERGAAGGSGRSGSASGVGFALRIATELVAALVVGGVIGYLLDQWLGTTPWLMLVFFLLGAVAGFMNVYRVMMRSTQVVGHGPKDTDKGA